ncbi:MAG: histidinol dehydrogenase [Gemmatimonadota bacterium]
MSTSLVSTIQLGFPVGLRVADLSAVDRKRLFERGHERDADVTQTVTDIIEQVRAHGDAALRSLALRFDRVELRALEVNAARCRQAYDDLTPEVRAALEQAASAIRAFHSARLPAAYEIEVQRGVRIGRKPEPLASVGVYAPGGRAAYPSSVLMGVIPAKAAGVREVIVCSPAGTDSEPATIVLAACALAGADRVFALGGAGAIAALALGTESVPRVDKITGPGNAWVTEAKRQLVGDIAIDCPAGPSEILILADESADAEIIARELMAQAEHDTDAAAVLVTTHSMLIDQVRGVLERVIAAEARAPIIEAALAANAALLLADNEAEMVHFAEAYAPEHLLLLTRDPRVTLAHVRNAGSVFLGAGSSVAFGDYSTGANHVLPTAGRARAYSGLSTDDFVRWFTYQEVSAEAAVRLAEPTAVLADAEGLPAHAAAARLRAAGIAQASDNGPPLRPAYRGIELYDPQRAPCEIDLSDNTNLFGLAAAAQLVLGSGLPERTTRYPAVFAEPLKQAIAEWYQVAPENVVTGCGSDDVIDSALRAFCDTGDRVVLPVPTFSMVAEFARMNAVPVTEIPMLADLTLDDDRLISAGGRVTYICNPNNPTGTAFSGRTIERIGARIPGVLLLDEAYADYATEDFARTAAASARMISLRTFSKIFGLAGLRVGFAIGPAALVREIEKSRGPYKVNAFAAEAAIAMLTHEREWLRARIDETRANREQLSAELQRLAYRPLPSAANFLLVPVLAGQTAVSLATALRVRGVAVRPYTELPGLGDAIRVTVGPWWMMQRLLTELAHV